MKNLAKLILTNSLVASCAFAQGAFVGIGGEYNFKTKLELTQNGTDASDHNGFISLKGGYDFDTYRTYALYNYNNKILKIQITTQDLLQQNIALLAMNFL